MTDKSGALVVRYIYGAAMDEILLRLFTNYYLPPPLPTVSSSPAATISLSSVSMITGTGSTRRRWGDSCKQIHFYTAPLERWR